MGLHPDAAPTPGSPRRPVPRRANPLLLSRSPNFAAKSPTVEALADPVVQGLGEPAQNLDSLDSVVESLHEVPESDLESNLPPLISVNVLEAADETETKKEEVEQPKETVPTLDMQNVEPQSDAPASAQPSTHNTSEWTEIVIEVTIPTGRPMPDLSRVTEVSGEQTCKSFFTCKSHDLADFAEIPEPVPKEEDYIGHIDPEDLKEFPEGVISPRFRLIPTSSLERKRCSSCAVSFNSADVASTVKLPCGHLMCTFPCGYELLPICDDPADLKASYDTDKLKRPSLTINCPKCGDLDFINSEQYRERQIAIHAMRKEAEKEMFKGWTKKRKEAREKARLAQMPWLKFRIPGTNGPKEKDFGAERCPTGHSCSACDPLKERSSREDQGKERRRLIEEKFQPAWRF